MNNHDNSLSRIQEIITKGRSFAILIPPSPPLDAVASATSLYLGLLKMGKIVSLGCSQMPQSDLSASDKFQTNFATGGDSLMVSFPYSDGAIDKVDYNIQGNQFNLIVTPRPGYPKLNSNQVNYSYTGGIIDVIITIDTPTLNSLGTVYIDNQNQFTGHDIINIDRHLTNAYFGTVNFVNKTISSVSELILSILQTIGVEIDRDIATNIYAGIAASTNNFTSYSTNAETFEHIATLLRLGAVKKTFKRPEMNQPQVSFQTKKPPQPVIIKPQSSTGPEAPKVTPIESIEKEAQPEKPQSAQDWLKPKIFQGGGLI
jgi:hypothetical protein